jgi:putative membrane protein
MSSNNESTNSTPNTSLSPNRARRGMMGWIFGALAILVLVGLFVVPFFYGPMVGPSGYYDRPYFFPFGSLVFFFVIFFVARGLFWGWGWGWGWRGGYSRGYWRHGGYYSEAEEILKQRYAKGEITKDQFDQMMRDLQAHDA